MATACGPVNARKSDRNQSSATVRSRAMNPGTGP
ncbi:hypothetical protein SMICM17S_08929 [Streptomyces microflavus]